MTHSSRPGPPVWPRLSEDGGRKMPTTEHVTVLFTDLVGSTELSSALAPEAADELRRKHFSALRQAIAASGGTEVKNLGDGLMVVFPTSSGALACAVAMQQAVDRDNDGTERPLGLRVGLSAGEATKETDDYFGDPVVEASRLCARAEAGQILATDLLRMAAGRRSPHTFSSLGELELKGLPEPIETLEVGWEPLGEAAPTTAKVPLPTRLAHRPGVGVIGRENELALLSAAAKRVGSGEGREVILVAGEPGQGKTTLVSELTRRAHEGGSTVLLGRCDEEVGAPYRPFAEALSHFVTHTNEELLRPHVAAHGGELARMVPALQQRIGELPPTQTTDADTERYLLYAAAVGLLEEASAQAPVVLVLDDLHWADKPSLQLLRHVVANTSSARLLVLCTYRDGELSASHPLTETLAGLHREPTGVSSIDLKGLDDTGVIAFMESAAGHELDDAGVGLAHQLYRETDGNPYFVSEVLRHLSETGAIVQDATGRWTAADAEGFLDLPHSVRAVIGTRVSRLGEQFTKVLSKAAVIGRDFELDLLTEVTGSDEDELIDLLEDAQRAAVVQEIAGSPGRYSFSHTLIQHTLYEDLGATRRTRVHKSVGEAIERLYGEGSDDRVGELARHFLLATRPADAQKAITYARRAGEAALSALAPDDAVRYFSQALELASPGTFDAGLRLDLLIGLGTAQRQAGDPSFRENLLEAARGARELGDTGRLVEAALANSRGFFTSLGQVDIEKVDVLEAALAALPETDTSERARLLATLCGELAFHSPLPRRLALADEAAAMARRLGDPATLIDVFNRCNAATRFPSRVSRHLEEAAEAISLSRAIDDPSRLFSSAVSAADCALCAGKFDMAAEYMTTVQDLAERLRQPQLVWQAGYRAAAQAIVHGDAQEAEQLATAVLEVGTASGQPDAFAYYGTQLMGVRNMQGRYGEMVPLIADVAQRNPAIPTYRAVLAVAHLEAGDEPAARDLFDEVAAASFCLPEDVAWSTGIVRYARVAIELEIRDHAGRLFDLLAPFHDQVPHNGITSTEPVAMYLAGLAALLGRYSDAEEYFAEAAELNTRGGMRFAEAQTNLLRGRMLRTRGEPGDAERARAMLTQACDSAATRGYASVERRAEAELSKLI
jgi:class 3 adenylate cyclase/tetratricopeptide (TPR) repeat protein